MAVCATHRWTLGLAILLTALGAVTPAAAHVKWFAPYIVGAPPAPVDQTLRDGWFWLAISLVLAFFSGTRFVEIGPYGGTVLNGLD